MKHLTILLVSILFCYGTMAQSNRGDYPRKQLYEIFTSSTCGPCANANPVLDALLEKNEGKFSIVKYQVNWPGSGDIYYLPQTGKRVNYYAVSGVPSLFVNGIGTSPYSLSQQTFNQNAALTTPVKIELEAKLTTDTIVKVTVSVQSNKDYEAGNLLHVMLLEGNTYKNKSYNGELEFRHVLMGYFTPVEGKNLGAIKKDSVYTFNFSLPTKGTNIEELWNLEVVAFIQDQSKNILQSEMKESQVELDFNMITATVLGEDSLPIAQTEMFMFSNNLTGSDGIAKFYSYSGKFTINIGKQGYYPIDTLVEISGNTSLNLVLKKPQSLLFENFDFTENDKIPQGWKSFSSSAGISVRGKQLFFFQHSGANDDNILVTPEVNLAAADQLTFLCGNKYYKPKLEIGVLSEQNNMETYRKISTIEPAKDSMTTVTIDFKNFTGTERYIALKMPYTNGNANFFADDLMLSSDTEEGKYALTLTVHDDVGEPLPGANVSIEAQSILSDANGVAIFFGLSEGSHKIQVHKDQYNQKEETFEITDNNLIKTISLIKTGLAGSEKYQIKVFPNPASNRIYIEGADEGCTIKLFGIDGKMLINSYCPGNSSSFDVSHLQAGVYIFKIQKINGTEFTSSIQIK